ncbi:Cwf15:Cwc15 cell cycle control protein [Trichuris trichiura]|uniref:Cwf15:Cwc15 cell cycle control protein n=1 Tax=Trichuris trichiura TaxID=36087 RepID=A0A077Z2F6_TRITR|nr:Cwf15:Cwc15 cell cycle control protein [Trichuris trichiura]
MARRGYSKQHMYLQIIKLLIVIFLFLAMTTAHRATYTPAQGGFGKNEADLSKLSKQYSSRDLPSHTKLKYRQTGQASAEELKSRDFLYELENREREAAGKRRTSARMPCLIALFPLKVSITLADSPPLTKKKSLNESAAAAAIGDADESPERTYDEDDTEDDEDDTAELLAELARIKAEREAEKAAEEAKRQAEEEQIRVDKILHGNPLLTSTKQDFKVQRRWDDDVVFKNCAKGISEKKSEPTFINDALRSEFHKKFMEKYIK